MNRATLVKLHRYLGLVLALFLTVLGVTGSIIVFDPEIDAWLNPDLFELERPGAEPLPAAELIRRVEASDPRIEAYYLALADAPRKAAVVYVTPRSDPATGEPFAVDYDEVFIDPATGNINGHRLWGECCFERRNFVPFVYKLHNRLLLPIDVGRPLLGGVALLWLALLVIGAWLTWPARGPRLRNWARAFAVSTKTSGFRTTLSVHRAAGLWLWPVLVVLALTGAVLGFEDQARTLVGTFSPLSSAPASSVVPENDNVARASFTDAVAAARAWIGDDGRDLAPAYVSHSDQPGLYRVRLGDAYAAGLEEVTVYVSEAGGHVLGMSTARGATAGDLVMNANQPLHAGRIAGMPGRVLVFLGGLVVTALSITGVLMWGTRKFRMTRRSA